MPQSCGRQTKIRKPAFVSKIDEIRRENISLEGLSDDNLESLVGTKLRIPRGL